MIPTLLLQEDVFSEDQKAETKEILQSAWAGPIISIQDEQIFLNTLPKHPDGPHGAFRGSLALAQRLGRKFPYADAQWWTPRLRTSLLSEDYQILDAGSLRDRKDIPWPRFIRPTSGTKTFAGQIFTKEKFREELHWLKQAKNEPDTFLCLHATPTLPDTEFRTVIINGKIVASCQYMEKGELNLSPNTPKEILGFAGQILENLLEQENLHDFVLDVGIHKSQPKVIELNALETASFYACDLETIYTTWFKSLL